MTSGEAPPTDGALHQDDRDSGYCGECGMEWPCPGSDRLKPDPFAGMETHALRPWTDPRPTDLPAPTPRPPVTVGPLDVDGLRELLGRDVLDLFGRGVYHRPDRAGVRGDYGLERLCRCRVIGEGAA